MRLPPVEDRRSIAECRFVRVVGSIHIGLAGALTHGGNSTQLFAYLLPALSIQPTSQHEAVEAEN